MLTLVMQPSFRALSHTQVKKWQTLEKAENKRQMYGSQSNVWQSVHPIQIRDKCMTVSAPKPYCHPNKRQMYDSQCTQA